MVEAEYNIEVAWPWTSDKAFCACVYCHIGVLVMFDKPGLPIHKLCLEEIIKNQINIGGRDG
jgi:hypothetical protein